MGDEARPSGDGRGSQKRANGTTQPRGNLTPLFFAGRALRSRDLQFPLDRFGKEALPLKRRPGSALSSRENENNKASMRPSPPKQVHETCGTQLFFVLPPHRFLGPAEPLCSRTELRGARTERLRNGLLPFVGAGVIHCARPHIWNTFRAFQRRGGPPLLPVYVHSSS